MEPDHIQTISQRDQLWASLRMLKPFIDDLANGLFNDTDSERQIVQLLARIVTAELEFRSQNPPESPPAGETT